MPFAKKDKERPSSLCSTIWVIVGCGLGAALHGFVPDGWIAYILEQDNGGQCLWRFSSWHSPLAPAQRHRSDPVMRA